MEYPFIRNNVSLQKQDKGKNPAFNISYKLINLWRK